MAMTGHMHHENYHGHGYQSNMNNYNQRNQYGGNPNVDQSSHDAASNNHYQYN